MAGKLTDKKATSPAKGWWPVKKKENGGRPGGPTTKG
jgi:hypothetical protein